MLFALVLAFVLAQSCNTVSGTPQDRRVNKDVLTVGTYNAYWLFLSKWDKVWSSLSEAEEHLADIAQIVKDINVDILVLEEVESCAVLAALLDQVGDSTYKYYLIPGTDSATGQNVGLITRVDPAMPLTRSSARADFPISGSKCSGNSGDTGVSKHFYTRFTPSGFNPFTLVALHLIAIPDDDARCLQREAQATVVKSIVTQQLKQFSSDSVVILGDLNDYDGVTLDILASTPISQTLQVLKSSASLTNAAELVPQSSRYTDYYDPSGCRSITSRSSSIDHILVTDGFANSITFFNGLYDPPCMKPDGLFSDHWPLAVSLNRQFVLGEGEQSTDTLEGQWIVVAASVLLVLAIALTVAIRFTFRRPSGVLLIK